MSKMFDALRRAEAERRRKASDEAAAPVLPRDAMHDEARVRGDVPRARAAAEPLFAQPAAVPEVPSTNGANPFPGDLMREIGILRNSIESRLERSGPRVLVFTSAMHGEGVTTMASAYARLLAMHGHERVLVVELNARSPALAGRYGIAGREGVTHYFSGQRTLASLVQAVPHEGYDVLLVGEPDPGRIQIYLEKALPRLMDEARKSYDTIVIDAPPIVLCPETPPLARHADGVIVVVQCGRTKRETIQRSINLVGQFEGRVLGIVLNRKRYYIPDFIYRHL